MSKLKHKLELRMERLHAGNQIKLNARANGKHQKSAVDKLT